jgi:hypothetical protein
MSAALALALGAPLAFVGFGNYWMLAMGGRSYSGPLAPLNREETAVRDGLQKHIQSLAGDIGERNLWKYDALEKSARYIERAFGEAGYTPKPQPFLVQGKAVRNIESETPGTSLRNEIVVVGAHYDSVQDCPGANDNGSGVAAMLEIARLLANRQLPRTVRYVAFVNEEEPFFLNDHEMGSRVYARRSHERNEKIAAMFTVETIGYYSDKDGSQEYPFPFNLLYPKKGNFIGFVGNLASRSLTQRCLASFRRATRFPSEGVAAPSWVPGIGMSDHASFWSEGYPAVMITDTAPFRYPDYHSETDTPDKIDYERTARVTTGLARMVAEVAGGKNP